MSIIGYICPACNRCVIPLPSDAIELRSDGALTLALATESWSRHIVCPECEEPFTPPPGSLLEASQVVVQTNSKRHNVRVVGSTKEMLEYKPPITLKAE